MRALLGLGGLASAVGVGLLAWGVRQQVAWGACHGTPRCDEPAAWPVTLGIFVLIGGGFLLAWTVASGLADRVLHPERLDIADPAQLRRVGVAGSARVLRSERSGAGSDDRPLMDVELSVEVPGRPPYLVRRRLSVPRSVAGQLSEGQRVPVLVDPDHPDRLLLEWETEPALAGAPSRNSSS
jgi:hypothetical protein